MHQASYSLPSDIIECLCSCGRTCPSVASWMCSGRFNVCLSSLVLDSIVLSSGCIAVICLCVGKACVCLAVC